MCFDCVRVCPECVLCAFALRGRFDPTKDHARHENKRRAILRIPIWDWGQDGEGSILGIDSNMQTEKWDRGGTSLPRRHKEARKVTGQMAGLSLPGAAVFLLFAAEP